MFIKICRHVPVVDAFDQKYQIFCMEDYLCLLSISLSHHDLSSYLWLILFCMKTDYQNDWTSNIEHNWLQTQNIDV